MGLLAGDSYSSSAASIRLSFFFVMSESDSSPGGGWAPSCGWVGWGGLGAGSLCEGRCYWSSWFAVPTGLPANALNPAVVVVPIGLPVDTLNPAATVVLVGLPPAWDTSYPAAVVVPVGLPWDKLYSALHCTAAVVPVDHPAAQSKATMFTYLEPNMSLLFATRAGKEELSTTTNLW